MCRKNGAIIFYMTLRHVFKLLSNIPPPEFCCQCLLYTYSYHQKENQTHFILLSYTQLICKTAIHRNNYTSGCTKSYLNEV